MAEDSEYLVFTVVLFRRVVDSFKTSARARGFQVKEAGPLPGANGTAAGGSVSSVESAARLAADAEEKRAALEAWCITSYGEAFSGW